MEHVRLFVWVGVWSNGGGNREEKGLRWLGLEERDDTRLVLLAIPRLVLLAIPVPLLSAHLSTLIPPFSSNIPNFPLP